MLQHEALQSFRTVTVLGPERLEVGGKPFVQPNVGPVLRRDHVAEPLMSELVHDDGLELAVTRDEDVAPGHRRRVLHRPIPLEEGHPVLLAAERVTTEYVAAEVQHLG